MVRLFINAWLIIGTRHTLTANALWFKPVRIVCALHFNEFVHAESDATMRFEVAPCLSIWDEQNKVTLSTNVIVMNQVRLGRTLSYVNSVLDLF